MQPRHIVKAALALGLCSALSAQSTQTFLVDPGQAFPLGSSRPPSVQRVELTAGGVIAGPRITGPLQAQFRDLARVGNEFWAATSEGLVRLDPANLQQLAASLPDVLANAVVPRAAGGATIFGFDRVALVHVAVEIDSNGAETLRVALPGVVTHAIAYQQGYLVVSNGQVERFDSAYNAMGPFAPNAAALAAQNQTSYLPQRLTSLGGGRVAIVCAVSIITTDAAGIADALWNVVLFESGALMTGAGDLLVVGALELVLLDPVAGAISTHFLHGLSTALPYFIPAEPITGTPVSTRFCPGAPNSTGRAAAISLLGTDDVDDGALQLFVQGLPPGAVTLPIYGGLAGSTPLGNGTLCIAPLGGIVRSVFGAAAADGSYGVVFDFVNAGLGREILAGTNWNFQAVYRDVIGAGFSTSDAVSLTFQP